MRYESAFEVAGTPAEVIETFADLPAVASFLPGASVGPANAEGRHPGTLTVSFGPKELAFRGTVKNEVDRAALAGVVSGTANADVRGAKMAVAMRYRLSPGIERPGGTRVSIDSDAELAGMLAEFAKTGGVVLANAILADFAKRLSAHFEAQAAGSAASSAPAAAMPDTAAAAAIASASPSAPPTSAPWLASAPASAPALASASTPASAPASASTPAAAAASAPASASTPARASAPAPSPAPGPASRAAPPSATAPATLSATALAVGVMRALAVSFGRSVARGWRALVGRRT